MPDLDNIKFTSKLALSTFLSFTHYRITGPVITFLIVISITSNEGLITVQVIGATWSGSAQAKDDGKGRRRGEILHRSLKLYSVVLLRISYRDCDPLFYQP